MSNLLNWEEIASSVKRDEKDQSSESTEVVAGIDTSLTAVQQYVESLMSQIRAQGDDFLQAFLTPIYKEPLKVLQRVQEQNLGQGGLNLMNLGTLEGDESFASILNVQLYLTIEKARENIITDAFRQLRETTPGVDTKIGEVLSEADHIHNKALFDAINEAMKGLRPYGKSGEPLPWSLQVRKQSFVYVSAQSLDTILAQVQSQVTQWASFKFAGQDQLETTEYAKPDFTKSKHFVVDQFSRRPEL